MPHIDTNHLQHVAAVADEAVRSGLQPSAVIAVADSKETIWTHVAPGADGVKLDSIFLLGSITKPIVATAIMRLVEEGKLLLNVPVAAYIPKFAGNGKERITAFHLLTHCSGMEEESFWQELQQLQGPPADDYLWDACCRDSLLFEPGTAYQYNSLTFSVLGELITRLGGMPYPDYLREHIFKPLGMDSTAFYPLDRGRAAPVYDFGPPEQLELFNTLAVPGGGLWSTADDLIAFGQTFLRGGRYDGYKLLAPATIATMTRHYTAGKVNITDGTPFNYALGWGKPSSPPTGGALTSECSYGHGGVTGTLLWIDPEYDLVFVFLSNRWDMKDPLDAKGRALNAVYGAIRNV